MRPWEDMLVAQLLSVALCHHRGEARMPGRGVSSEASAGHRDVSRAGQRQPKEEAELALQDGRVLVQALP